jgi:hypothetical protein
LEWPSPGFGIILSNLLGPLAIFAMAVLVEPRYLAGGIVEGEGNASIR